MAMLNPYEQYQQNAAHTATPAELALMLYNGLVKNIKQSIMAIADKDIQSAHNCILKAQDIVIYLDNSLDEGNELSKNLSALYDYMSRRMMEANIKKDSEIMEEILTMAEDLRDTWQQAMKKSISNG